MRMNRKLQALESEIRRHDDLYYGAKRPEISDAEYDALVGSAERLKGKALDGVGHAGGGTVQHAAPMLSMKNTYSAQGVEDFMRRTAGAAYVVEPKYDGVALAVQYSGGRVVSVSTRGDGRLGKAVSVAVDVPMEIPETGALEIRGEAVMLRKDFETLNQERAARGEKAYTSPRHAVAGYLNRKTPSGLSPMVRFIAFDAIGEAVPDDQIDLLAFLERQGFTIPSGVECFSSVAAIVERLSHWTSERGSDGYDTDGMVVKVRSRKDRRPSVSMLGPPTWALAYKFAPEQAETVIESIDVTIGKTGRRTPVATVREVTLRGVRVRRVSLGSEAIVERMGCVQGSVVVVSLVGDAIPVLRMAV